MHLYQVCNSRGRSARLIDRVFLDFSAKLGGDEGFTADEGLASAQGAYVQVRTPSSPGCKQGESGGDVNVPVNPILCHCSCTSLPINPFA
jgi:hypothetical protein